jgi:hypothetical protein
MFAEDCPFKVVRTNGSDEVLARAGNLLKRGGGVEAHRQPLLAGRKTEPKTDMRLTGAAVADHDVQRDNYDGRLPTIKLAKSGSRRVARRELPV